MISMQSAGKNRDARIVTSCGSACRNPSPWPRPLEIVQVLSAAAAADCRCCCVLLLLLLLLLLTPVHRCRDYAACSTFHDMRARRRSTRMTEVPPQLPWSRVDVKRSRMDHLLILLELESHRCSLRKQRQQLAPQGGAFCVT